MEFDGGAYNARTVEDVFLDYKGRRDGLITALTTDVADFYRQCDPAAEDDLCLYGHPGGRWKVNIPEDQLYGHPGEIPEPALGINFFRDAMEAKDWLAFVAAHSDSWLHSVAFYSAARFGFDKGDRERLFGMINELPTVSELVKRAPEPQPPEYAEPMPEDEEGGGGDTLCGGCGENYATSDELWICCDICEKWFHGKCVNISVARAEHIRHYKCPSCSTGRWASVEDNEKFHARL